MRYQTRVFSNRSDMLDRLADVLLHTVLDALNKQDAFRLVIGGGRTQQALNSRIAALETPSLDWRRILIYLSDERCVPLNHAQSNFRLNVDTLIKPLGIPVGNFHRLDTTLSPARAAAKYAELLAAIPRDTEGRLFDLSLLGLGPDGHTASLFPGSPVLKEQKRLAAAAGPGPEGLERITLTYRALNASSKLWIMVTGKEKREPVSRLLNGPHEPKTCPAQGIKPISKEITLWLDRDAMTPNNH